MLRPQDLLREYAPLNRKRKQEGVTLLEYQRWRDLAERLDREFPERPPLDSRGPIRVNVAFKTRERLAQAVMLEVRPIGLFVSTPFAPELGTKLTLCVQVEETAEEFEADVAVVSSNLGPDFSTANLGMGARFASPTGPFIDLLDALCLEYGRAPRKNATREVEVD
ncbi:MAG: hypothetical protein ACE5EV_09600 [Gaiellales bacterium]